MPRGPQGQRRPNSTTGCAVRVMEIATGQVDENVELSPLPAERPLAHNVLRERPPSEGCLDELPILGSHLVPPDEA